MRNDMDGWYFCVEGKETGLAHLGVRFSVSDRIALQIEHMIGNIVSKLEGK